MYVLSAVYGSIRSDTHNFSWFLLPVSYNGSFARVRINTSLNNHTLTLAPDNLLLFSLPGAVGVSEAQKRRCARLSLTPDFINHEHQHRLYIALTKTETPDTSCQRLMRGPGVMIFSYKFQFGTMAWSTGLEIVRP
jgi:hypothetical protein